MAKNVKEKEAIEREEPRQQFPFEGLHVYQRAQDAWSAAQSLVAGEPGDPLWAALEQEVRHAATGIARATARSRANGHFATALEEARGALHAAAAIVDQQDRRGGPSGDGLRALLSDSSRMLGALIRSLNGAREESSAEATV